MTDRKDPPRLLDALSGAPPGLRDLLSAARNDIGSDAQVARLVERLGPVLGPPPLPAQPVTATASAVGAAVKLGITGVALVIAVGGAWLLSSPRSAPPAAAVSPSPRAEPTPTPAPAASSANGTIVAVEPPKPDAAGVELPGVTKPPPKPAPSLQSSEADLLEQARSALKSDATRALARANEHRSRFPGGVLVQEREVIAIQALRQLGRTAEADRRAEAFQKAFPGSAFQRRLK
jgi:hypothetical protein